MMKRAESRKTEVKEEAMKTEAKKVQREAAVKTPIKKIEKKDDRSNIIEMAIKQIEKTHGKGAIMRLGADFKVDVSHISTGSFGLDLALGVGGIPRGRIVEIFGPEASGKTTLALQIAANAQKEGGIVAFVDTEHALDPTYSKNLGVDLDNLLVSQPDTGEQALDIVDTLVRTGVVDVIIVDSVAALIPRVELEGEMGDQQIGLQARLMSKALRKLTAISSKAKTTIIFTNQIREKIGVMFGSPQTTPGGRALKFYASIRIDIRRIGQIKDGMTIIGNRTRVKVVKNKVAPPFRQAEFELIYSHGISREGELLDGALEKGLMTQRGAWYSFGDENIGQGREEARSFLEDNPDIAAKIEKELLSALQEQPGAERARKSA